MDTRPGSRGEHELQDSVHATDRACAFYDNQMLDHLNPLMCTFIARQDMVFIATADAHGECDCSFRAGPPGFVHVLNEKTLVYPEYRGNGVMASLGNIRENAHIGLVFIDFFATTTGLHVNGRAHIVERAVLLDWPAVPDAIRHALQLTDGRTPERWVMIEVAEAYIHCSKHIPLLQKLDKTIHWGTDDTKHKGGDFFHAKASARPWQTRRARGKHAMKHGTGEDAP